jgi:hypothetical protein
MGLDGLVAEDELVGDLAVGLAGGNQGGDFALPGSERIERGVWIGAGGSFGGVAAVAEAAQVAGGLGAPALCAEAGELALGA